AVGLRLTEVRAVHTEEHRQVVVQLRGGEHTQVAKKEVLRGHRRIAVTDPLTSRLREKAKAKRVAAGTPDLPLCSRCSSKETNQPEAPRETLPPPATPRHASPMCSVHSSIPAPPRT